MVAETIILGIISALCYDLLKKSGSFLKDDFIQYANTQYPNYDIDFLSSVADELEGIELNDDMSEKAIVKKLESKESLVKLINKQQIQPTQNLVQNNIHGDNIAGDKIINN